MKNIAPLAIAAVLALSGISAASANQMSSNAGNKMQGNMQGNTHGASDTLTLSDTQQKSIWKDVNHHAANQSAPSGFTAAVGTAVPSTVNTYPLPLTARRDVPAARPYRYAMMQDKVLLVNPSDHKIADVVAK